MLCRVKIALSPRNNYHTLTDTYPVKLLLSFLRLETYLGFPISVLFNFKCAGAVHTFSGHLPQFLSPNVTVQYLMKLEWLIANVTAVWSPIRAESAVFGSFLAFFGQIWSIFVTGEPLCGVGTSL